MEKESYTQSNPWVEDDTSLGTLKNVLRLAQETGHIQKGSQIDEDNLLEDERHKFPSIRLIEFMKEIESTRKQIDKLHLEIQRRLLDKETKDLTHLDVLEKKISMINSLNSQLQQIASQKSQLITRLQQPYVGDFLHIHASYKQYASELMPQVTPILSELSRQLDNIEWVANADMSQQQWEALLSDISSGLATLQSTFQHWCQRQTTIEHLHQERAPPARRSQTSTLDIA